MKTTFGRRARFAAPLGASAWAAPLVPGEAAENFEMEAWLGRPFPGGGRPGGGPLSPIGAAPYCQIAPDRDILAEMLAIDAGHEGRELWWGLAAAAVAVLVIASGFAVPVLAVAFTIAPVIGIGMEVFSRAE